MKKQIKIAVQGAATIDFKKLEPFQDELKDLEVEQYDKFRKGILDDGFSFVIHVWKNKGKNYIIDGHQRLRVLTEMGKEGMKIPPIPVAFVEAASFKAAKRKVLAGASQYGQLNQDGLYKFSLDNDIQIDDMLASFEFPEVDLMKFKAGYFDLEGPEAPDGSTEINQADVAATLVHTCPKCGFQFSSPKEK